MRITYSRHARRDLDQIWISTLPKKARAPTALIDCSIRSEDTCNRLGRSPYIGRKRDEDLASGMRSIPCGNYLIFYRVKCRNRPYHPRLAWDARHADGISRAVDLGEDQTYPNSSGSQTRYQGHRSHSNSLLTADCGQLFTDTVHQRVGNRQMPVERGDAEVELFFGHDQRRRDDEVADPGLHARRPRAIILRGDLIDDQRLALDLVAHGVEGLLWSCGS